MLTIFAAMDKVTDRKSSDSCDDVKTRPGREKTIHTLCKERDALLSNDILTPAVPQTGLPLVGSSYSHHGGSQTGGEYCRD